MRIIYKLLAPHEELSLSLTPETVGGNLLSGFVMP
jgi:hypothetical protein